MFSVSPSLSKRHRVIVYMFYGKGPGRRTPFLCLLLFKRCIFESRADIRCVFTLL